MTVALTHVLRQEPPAPAPPWQRTLCLPGAEKLSGDVLDRLCDACEAARTGLVLAYRSLPGHVKERLGRGNAAVAFMRLGNAEDAKVASEQIGTEHRFVLTQLTDTVGTSATDTVGDSYTSTIGAADSVSVSASTSETSGRSRGSGHSRAGFGPFAPYTESGEPGRQPLLGYQRHRVHHRGDQPEHRVGGEHLEGDRGQLLSRADHPAIPGVPGRAA